MKNLKILMGAVGFLLLAWLIYRSEDCVGFLRRLSTSLDDVQFRPVTAAAFFAWNNVRSTSEVRGMLADVNPVLQERFARTASIAELQSMVLIANQKGYDSAAIDTALSGEAGRSVAAGNWGESRAGLLSVASLGAEDFGRAKRYLQETKWEEPETPEDRQSVTRLLHIVALLEGSRKGIWSPVETVGAWQSLSNSGVARTSVRPVLEKLAFQGLKPAAGTKAPGDFVRETAKESGAGDFWERVVLRSYGWILDGTTQNVSDFESLVHAIQTSFGRTGVESQAWTRAAGKIRDRYPDDAGWPARYFEKAAATAPDDSARATAVNELAACYMKAREFAQARRAVESAKLQVQDEKPAKILDETLKEVLKKEKEDLGRVAKAQKMVDQDRLRGQLDFMKKQLATARTQMKPSEDIQSLEQIVKQLERQLTE